MTKVIQVRVQTTKSLIHGTIPYLVFHDSDDYMRLHRDEMAAIEGLMMFLRVICADEEGACG
jgi:hypothetical protein